METPDANKLKDAIIAWIRDYFNKNGPDCPAVVAISGGKDSTIVAALCVEALGKDRVVGVLMPQGEQHDFVYAKDLAESLGIRHFILNIKDTVDPLLAALEASGVFINEPLKTNLPARVRMTALYAVSASLNGRVANTSNLSEDHVGYATKFGDSAGDFSPLMRLTVTEVKAVGRALGLADKFIDKVPEDGLSGKTDEDNLGFSYESLDKYIKTGVCEDAAVKEKIDRLHRLSRHKLEPIPCFDPVGENNG